MVCRNATWSESAAVNRFLCAGVERSDNVPILSGLTLSVTRYVLVGRINRQPQFVSVCKTRRVIYFVLHLYYWRVFRFVSKYCLNCLLNTTKSDDNVNFTSCLLSIASLKWWIMKCWRYVGSFTSCLFPVWKNEGKCVLTWYSRNIRLIYVMTPCLIYFGSKRFAVDQTYISRVWWFYYQLSSGVETGNDLMPMIIMIANDPVIME